MPSDKLQQLESLWSLRERGAITETEYDQQKAEILSGSGGGPPSRPESVGAYKLGDFLGKGGMGVVWKARHKLTSKAAAQGGDVALKLITGPLAESDEYRRRFEREADLGIRLDHPGVVQVHDLVVDGQRLGLVMELVEGRSLRMLMGDEPWEWGTVLARSDGLLDGLAHAHQSGVVHRDLKPDNILVPDDSSVPWKIADFGLARDLTTLAGSGSLSQGRSAVGTYTYMAPEQEAGKRVDARADVYAFGLVLYELMAGRLPWERDASIVAIALTKMQGLPPLDQLNPQVPAVVSRAVMSALVAEPKARPRDAGALRTELALARRKAGRARPVDSVTIDRQKQAREQAERKKEAERKARIEAEAAREAEAERKIEAERRAQLEAAAARRAEAEREAGAERQAEAKRKAEAERRAEIARKAEAERRAKAAREREGVAQREAEAARRAENERRAEATQKAEAQRRAEREVEQKARRQAAQRPSATPPMSEAQEDNDRSLNTKRPVLLMLVVPAGLLAIGLVGALALFGEESPPEVAVESVSTPQEVAEAAGPDGEEVYRRFCIACHSEDGSGLGGVLAADYSSNPEVLRERESAVAAIKHGATGEIGVMPPWGNTLDDAQIDAVYEYMVGRWGRAESSVATPPEPEAVKKSSVKKTRAPNRTERDEARAAAKNPPSIERSAEASPWGGTSESHARSQVQILSEPTGAVIFIGGKSVGIAPISTALAMGTHEVMAVLDGYQSAVRRVDVNTNTVTVPFKLAPTATVGAVNLWPGSGDLIDAEVYMNGTYLGTLPLTKALSEGSHTFRIVKAGGTSFSQGCVLEKGAPALSRKTALPSTLSVKLLIPIPFRLRAVESCRGVSSGRSRGFSRLLGTRFQWVRGVRAAQSAPFSPTGPSVRPSRWSSRETGSRSRSRLKSSLGAALTSKQTTRIHIHDHPHPASSPLRQPRPVLLQPRPEASGLPPP